MKTNHITREVLKNSERFKKETDAEYHFCDICNKPKRKGLFNLETSCECFKRTYQTELKDLEEKFLDFSFKSCYVKSKRNIKRGETI